MLFNSLFTYLSHKLLFEYFYIPVVPVYEPMYPLQKENSKKELTKIKKKKI